MTDDKNPVEGKSQQQTKELKETFIKKSFQYPEATTMQSRPAGADVQQPPVKQDKPAKKI